MPPTVGKGAISIAFVRPSVRLSVCPSVAYIANNSRTERPRVPKFGRKVPHLRCDSHTCFKVKRSMVRLQTGEGIPCRPNPAATLLVVGNALVLINEVALRLARLISGWVTVLVNHRGAWRISYPGLQSLVVPLWAGAGSSSKRWGVEAHHLMH